MPGWKGGISVGYGQSHLWKWSKNHARNLRREAKGKLGGFVETGLGQGMTQVVQDLFPRQGS